MSLPRQTEPSLVTKKFFRRPIGTAVARKNDRKRRSASGGANYFGSPFPLLTRASFPRTLLCCPKTENRGGVLRLHKGHLQERAGRSGCRNKRARREAHAMRSAALFILLTTTAARNCQNRPSPKRTAITASLVSFQAKNNQTPQNILQKNELLR